MLLLRQKPSRLAICRLVLSGIYVKDSPPTLKIRSALCVIVAISAVLAAIWLWYVPFLQNPDENSHADYVYALVDVARPFHVSEPKVKKDVTTQVRHIERMSNFYGVRDLNDFRVPVAYGSSAYFHAVDASAPKPSLFPPKSGSYIPYVMFCYPAGYYAVVASTMWIVSHVLHGSFVTAFFVSRALSIVALSFTLVASYALLLHLRFRSGDALAATAAIGFFPLTSWMSSYIQPDNFVATGATVTLLLAVRFKTKPFAPILSLSLGTVIGCIALIKTHYAFILLLSVACMFLGYTSPRLRGWFAVLRGWSLFVIPAVLAIALAPFATPVGHLGMQAHSTASTNLQLPIELADSGSTVVRDAITVFTDAFISGTSFHRFWNSFGWLDTPFFEPSSLSSIVEGVLSIISLVTLSVVLTQQMVILRRIVRVSKRRSPVAALALLTRDVALNAYVLWSAMLIGVFAVSPASGSLQGRYWLPVFVPLLYILATRLSKMSVIRERRQMQMVVSRTFLAYSVVSAPLAIHAMLAHYYGPNQRVSSGPLVVLDGIGRIGVHPYDVSVYDIDRRTDATLQGSIMRSTDGSRLAKARIVIDDRIVIPLTLGGNDTRDPWKRSIGFTATIPARTILPGEHRMTFEEIDDARVRFGWNDSIRLHAADASVSRS